MAKLNQSSINSAIQLGKRTAPTALKEVSITATPLKKGDDVYHLGDIQATHADILNAAPATHKDAIGKYLTNFRIRNSQTEKPVNGKQTMDTHYVLNSAGTKNDMYDMVNKLAQSVSKK